MKFVTTALVFSFLVFQVSATVDNGTPNAQNASVNSSPNHIGTNIGYQDCTPKQQAKISEAVMRANTMIGRSQFYLNKHKTSKTKKLYTTWFGPAKDEYYDAVSSRFNSMGHQASSFTYNCTVCGVRYPAPAYLVPVISLRTIRLCENFWKKSLFKSNSIRTTADFKAGWIIRELSRAPEKGSTKLPSWFVDRKGAKELAKEPYHAVISPNNYMYFAKNAPAPR